MATSGRKVSPSRQKPLVELPHPLPAVRVHEQADRPITAYAHDYPAGHRTTLHAHPRAQLLWAVSGVMRVETEAASFTLPPQRALFVPASMPHQVTMPGAVAMRALFISPDQAAGIALGAIVVGPLLRALILRLAEEPPDWALDGAAPALCDLALRELRAAPRLALGVPAFRDPRLRRIAAALHDDPRDARTLDHYAELAGASPRTLERAFAREAGMSFGRWRTAARLAAAVPLLAEGQKLDRVAHAVGYASASSFAAAWRAAFGTTPARAARLNSDQF